MTAKTTTFTVTLPNGETVTRGSKTKTYTHAVAALEVGLVADLQKEIATSKARMAEIAESHPNAYAWHAARVAELEQAIKGQPEDATVTVGDWWVQGWCSRADLAQKLHRQQTSQWRKAQVLEVH